MDMKELGKRIRAARVEKGLTQEELAERAEISPTHVSVLERGGNSIKLETFIKMCCALDMSADDILRDLVPVSCMKQASDLTDILHDQPQDVQRTALRIVRALINKY